MVASPGSPQLLILAFILASLIIACPVLADEIHVPDDYPTIQQALDAALPGWVILVAPGTYTGALNTNLDFGGKDIELRGVGGPEVTIIKCGWPPPNGYRRGLRFHSGETPAAIVEGITFTDGIPSRFENGSSPLIRNCIFSFHLLNAIECNASSPTFSHCTITDNATYNPAGGFHCINSVTRIDDCVFVRNNASAGGMGGGIHARSSSLVVTNSVFRENLAEGGGGIYIYDSSLTVSGCDFTDNYSDNYGGGGISCWDSPLATITNCRFFDNHRCSSNGSVIGSFRSPLMITNCSFAANGNCTQISIYNAHLTLERSIIAFGGGKAISCFSDGYPSLVTLRCCDIFGNQGGNWIECIAGQEGTEGNFSADPLFCNLPLGDLTLNEGSPCLEGNHPQGDDCGLIGAFDQGCSATAVEPTSWGAIKAAFRR